MHIQYEAEPEFEKPIDILLWASRVYLAHVVNRQPPPGVLEQTFIGAELRYLHDALVRVLDRLIVSCTVDLTIHASTCPCTAFHEQALITALRSLQNGSLEGFRAAMVSIVHPASVNVSLQDMSILAAGLSDIERFWPWPAERNSRTPRMPANGSSTRLH